MLSHGGKTSGAQTIGRLRRNPSSALSSENVSTLVKLAAGDFVEARVYQETGASIDIGEAFSSNPRRTFLAMTWVAAG